MLMAPTRWTSIPERLDREEMLDAGKGSMEEVRRSLGDLDRINRWLGGRTPLRRFLYPRVAARQGGGPIRVLDVGAGSGATSIAIARWAAENRLPVDIVAFDNNERHLAIARQAVRGRPSIRLLRGDARQLPFADDSFDFVFSTLLLHHFDPSVLRAMIPALSRISRGRVILNDLVRDRVPAIFFAATTRVFARSPLTQHDGPVSIRRAYTPGEMRRILKEAGLPRARIYTHGLYYRMTIVIDRGSQ
jgi:SAM-dependent methyltransferase